MKLNPGTYVILAFGLFIVFIITLVVKTYQIKVDLVSEDYYRQELQYQEKINKINHTKDQLKKITWSQNDQDFVLVFPVEEQNRNLNGVIEFYRPSDSSKDISIPVGLNTDGKQVIEKKRLINGLYKMRIDWQYKGNNYYTEEDIYIQ